MTTLLSPVYTGDSQLFKVNTYAEDGITAVTPLSCTCSVWEADTDSLLVNESAGTVGTGFAQFNWVGTSTPGQYESTLKVVIASGVVKTEHFRVEVRARPPEFTITLTGDIGLVRMWLGDGREGFGVLPDGGNLPDDSIQELLDAEGSVMRAVASACELLSIHWSRVADIAVGPRSESLSQVSAQYAKRAAQVREQHGYGAGDTIAFATGVARADGFAEEGAELADYFPRRWRLRLP